MILLAWVGLALAVLPLAVALCNLPFFRRTWRPAPAGAPISVLIPARDEALNIKAAVAAVLASRGVTVEVLVMDDDSSDETAALVAGMAAMDPRVRLIRAPPLPPGWAGKQHACWTLSTQARHPVLAFIDADVRLAPDALSQAVGALEHGRLDLVSGFPHQRTDSLAEALVIPWVHGLLMGYLPMGFMRLSGSPVFAAGCGQFMVVRADAYSAVGGHGAIRASLHDGLTLPRAFRRAGRRTGILDADRLATCRMYAGGAAVWRGFSKNATEGMAGPVALPVWTVLLGGGHVLPWLLAPAALLTGLPDAAGPALWGVAANLAFRTLLAMRFRQDWRGVVLHPVSVLLLLAIQWSALCRRHPPEWRGRHYSTA